MSEPVARDFLVPDLGEGLEEATVVGWLVAVGDEVTLNQPVVVVETAKAEVEVPSPFVGTVLELGGVEGETLRVGTLLIRIGPPLGSPAPTIGPEPTLVGYGHDEAIDRSRRRHAVGAAVAPPGGGHRLAKPPVRKLARSLGVDLDALPAGRGPGGIVTRADVEAAAETSAPPPATGEVIIPVRGVRARIVERMTASRARIPDATCSVWVECSHLLDVRVALNSAAERAGEPTTITPFSLLCRLVVTALAGNPMLNASFVEDGPEIRQFEHVHLGIGTATDRGLLVPVVRDAHRRSTLDLANEMARLAEGARQGTLTPPDLQGSTFTLSNFGALGLDEGIPVINHPEAAILGVGSIKERPVVVDGEVVARPTASLTLAFDHRVCDGAEAGRFLRDLRSLVEAPELALLHA